MDDSWPQRNDTVIFRKAANQSMQKLYQKIAEEMLGLIRSGAFAPGERLPSERDLAEQFEVSRPTVREAMISLEIRGVVEARHGSGIYVTEAPPVEAGSPELDIGAFELTEARCVFEGEAAALAATSMTDAELADLEKILREMNQENENHVHGELADRRFHMAIAAGTRNSAIVNVVEMLWNLREKAPLCANMLERARHVGVQPMIDEHRCVLEALKARDPQAARRAMRDHLNRVIQNLLIATEMDAVEVARSAVEAKRNELARRSAL